MKDVILNSYPNDFNIVSNYGCLNRVVRSLILTILMVGFIVYSPLSKELTVFFSIGIVIIGVIVSDKYVRRLYSDWPRLSRFNGKVKFSELSITINDEVELLLSECSELVFFMDHYCGFAVPRDYARSGNAMLFYKNEQEEVSIVKFNIFTETEYNELELLINSYKKNAPYFKRYLPYEIPHILKPDLTDRIKYS
jgi:hypothetical protein